MKATIVAAVFVVFYVFATPSVALPVRPLDSETETLEQILGDFEVPEDKHVPKRNCYDIMTEENQNKSDSYPVNLAIGRIDVYCDMTLQGGGWTVIMKRSDGSEKFNRSWDEYSLGFGNFKTEFFLGLEAIHALTAGKTKMELWIGIRSHEDVFEPYIKPSDVYKYARYGNFKVSGRGDNYMLTVGNYDPSSTAGDSFSAHSGMSFSTPDRDNDDHASKHCAQENKSGWWFYNCHDSNLNGVWKEGGRDPADPHAKDGIVWHSWKGDEYSLKNVIMAIKPVLQED